MLKKVAICPIVLLIICYTVVHAPTKTGLVKQLRSRLEQQQDLEELAKETKAKLSALHESFKDFSDPIIKCHQLFQSAQESCEELFNSLSASKQEIDRPTLEWCNKLRTSFKNLSRNLVRSETRCDRLLSCLEQRFPDEDEESDTQSSMGMTGEESL